MQDAIGGGLNRDEGRVDTEPVSTAEARSGRLENAARDRPRL